VTIYSKVAGTISKICGSIFYRLILPYPLITVLVYPKPVSTLINIYFLQDMDAILVLLLLYVTNMSEAYLLEVFRYYKPKCHYLFVDSFHTWNTIAVLY
jgi:hypothetical protein